MTISTYICLWTDEVDPDCLCAETLLAYDEIIRGQKVTDYRHDAVFGGIVDYDVIVTDRNTGCLKEPNE